MVHQLQCQEPEENLLISKEGMKNGNNSEPGWDVNSICDSIHNWLVNIWSVGCGNIGNHCDDILVGIIKFT